jgi:hypothetical protein
MIRLNSTTRTLQLFLAGAVTTNQLQVTVCYSDQTTSTYLGSTQLSTSNNTTAVVICSAPASGAVRDIDMVNVLNTDTASATVTIEIVDTSTAYQQISVALAVGDKLTYTHGSGWQVVSASGSLKQQTISSAGVTAVTAGTGLSGGTITSTGTIAIANTTVTAGSYTNANITVNAQGQITAAANGSGGGSVTSVSATAPVVSSGGTTPTISLASAYGDTQNPYGSKTANYVLAAPNGSSGTPTFRAIVAADIPTLNQNTTGSAGSVANSHTAGSGLSGSSFNGSAAITWTLATAYGDTINPYASKTANYVLAAPNGSAGVPTFRALAAADIPSLPYAPTAGSTSITTLGTITTGVWNGTAIANSYLANSSITLNGNAISLGGSATITAAAPYALTIGTGLSGSSYNGSSAVTIAIANSGVTSGTYGSATAIPQITVNAQGQITSISTNTLNSPAYQGTWNASTNTPTLTSSSGTNNNYYIVSVAGTTTLNGISLWSVGDWVIYNGTTNAWEKINGSSSEAFTSLTVTGLTGYMYANGSSAVTASTTIPTTALSGTVTNAQLTNSSITINGSSVSLGGSTTVTATASNALTIGSGLSGTSYNGSTAVTIALATAYGDTVNPYASKTANYFLAAPNGSAGAPTFRAIVVADIPTLNQNTTGNAATATTATNIAGGSTYSLPYQTSSGTTQMLSAGTSGSLLMTLGTVTAPTWVAPSSLTVGTATQVSNSHTAGTGLSGSSFNGSAAVTWTLATAYGDTINPYASKTANYVLAAPNGSAGVPSFRAIVAADIPTLNQNTTGSAGSVANALTIGNGLSGTSYNGSGAVTIAVATTITTGAFVANETITGSLSAGAYSYGTLSYSDVNLFASFSSSVNTYNQIVLQNTNSGSAASTDYVVSNNNGTATTYYGDFGMNSSTFSGTGSLSGANNVYLTSTSADLAIGTTTSNAIHFVINGSATDAMTINTSGAIAVNGSYGTLGQVLTSGGSGSAPTWSNASGGSSPPALNVNLMQNYGGFL